MSGPVRGWTAGRVLVPPLLGVLALPVPTLAHGPDPGPPDASLLLTGWSFQAEVWLPVLLAAGAYRVAKRRVDSAHPANPVPRYRWWAWLAGLVALLAALASPIERYDTTLFSAHMLQHLLLTFVAAPLLVLGAPITLLLRVADRDARRRIILPVLHSRALRVLAFPLVTWGLFALVMWGSHFSPLFDAALEDPLIHLLEHALFLGTALLFWWPVVGADPAPSRLPHAARVAYLALGMPFGTFLGLAILSATTVLYPHYQTSGRTWGMTPLEDQVLAGGIMWAGGDAAFLVALVLAIGVWLRSEDAAAKRLDARLDREGLAAGDVGAPERT